MPHSSVAQQNWLAEALAGQFASVIETIAGERPAVQCEILESPPPAELAVWEHTFCGTRGAVWLGAAERGRKVLGAYQAQGASSNGDAGQSAFLAAAGRALSGLAQTLSGRLGREVSLTPGIAGRVPTENAVWAALEFRWGAVTITIHAGFETALLDGLSGGPGEEAGVTFDLLLDVELPVSVSFGRAQVPLKDVLKLTAGSIVELDRSVVEPVEVLIDNRVIARGEVVVVEGNFGVRIQHVVSRQERLRTVN